MRIIFILLSLSLLYPNMLDVNHHIKYPSWIFTMGNSVPANSYDSYGSDGFAFKVAFESPIEENNNLRYNFGWQNISFGENIVFYENYDGLQIREGEKANLFDVGVKFIINEGIAGNGLFRPYVNGSVGFGFFKQYTVYDYPNTWENTCDNFFNTFMHWIFDQDCENYIEDNENSVVDNRMYSPFMTVDFGTQFAFKNPARYAIEFGVRYSLIKNIESSDWQDWQDWENIEDSESFTDILGRKLNADYKTIYLGLSWYFMPPPEKQNNQGGYGKQI